MDGKSAGGAKVLMTGKTFGERITRLTKVLDLGFHTEQSEIDLANLEGRLRPGISITLLPTSREPSSVRFQLRYPRAESPVGVQRQRKKADGVVPQPLDGRRLGPHLS